MKKFQPRFELFLHFPLPQKGDGLLLDFDCFRELAHIRVGGSQRVQIARIFPPGLFDGLFCEAFSRSSDKPDPVAEFARMYRAKGRRVLWSVFRRG